VKIFLILICSISTLFAQDEIWYFGASKEGLDFSSGTPIPIKLAWDKGPSDGFYECNASFSDGNGNILFYTDGLGIYNKDNVPMPNGANLQGPNEPGGFTGSSSQGVIIVQDPGNSDRFYVLYADCLHNNFSDGYRYSVVDMTLDGGKGDVTLKDIVIMDGSPSNQVGEFLNATCFSGVTWVLSHRVDSDEFLAHRISSTGIDLNPVISKVGPSIGNMLSPGNMRGTMSFSHSGDKIALASGGKGVYIFDFDLTTGEVSNAQTVEEGGVNYYGTECSPDGTKLYYSNYTHAPGMNQYDLNTKSIHSYGGATHGSIRLAPDGKIYAAPGAPARTFLSVINNPNAAGAAAGFNVDGVSGFSGGWITLGLPDNFVCLFNEIECSIDTLVAQCDSTTAPIQMTASPDGGAWSGGLYIGPTGLFTPSDAGDGNHLVIYDNGCDEPDSMYIVVNECCPNIDPELGDDVTICGNTEKTLNVVGAFAEIKWFKDGVLQVASTGKSDFVASSGTYRVEVENAEGCSGSDEIIISTHAVPNPTITGNGFYCAGSDVTLKVDAGFDDYGWSPSGGIQREATINSTGTFTVTVKDGNGCIGTDDITISERALPTPEITGSNIVCGGASIELTVSSGGGTLNWTDTGNDENPRTVAAEETYTITETDSDGCIGSDDHTVSLESAPIVELGDDFSICPNQQQIEIGPTEIDDFTYSWNTFDTTGTIKASDAGTYSITVTSPAGCKSTDEVVVNAHTLPTVEIVSLSGDTFYCEDSDVTLTTDAVFVDYDWSSGGDDREETVGLADKYSVTVTDGNRCTATDDIDITENELPTIDLGGNKTVCGTDFITLDATHPDADTYVWTPNNEGSPTIIVSSEDATYGVTIADVDGCEFSTSIDVTEENIPTVYIGGDAIICDNVTKTLDAGSGSGYSYTWYLDDGLLPNDGQTIDADSGIYRVVVSTEYGCEASDTAYLDNHQLPDVTLNSDYEFCAGDSVKVDAGPNGTDYSWNNEETAQSFFVKTGGSLTVEITDGNNCTNKATATITENALPVVNLAASDSACEGREIELDVTLPNGMDYKWSDGTSGPKNTQIGPGTISVVVTNEKGCVDSTEMVVKELDPLDMSAFDDKHQVCFGMEEETPYVAGSFEEAVYDWTLPDGGLEEGQSIVPYLNGTYTLNVTDKFNCIGTHEFENAVIRVPFIDLGPDTSFCSVGKGIYNVRMEIEDMNVQGKLTWEDSYGRTDNNNENDTIFTVKDAPITIFGTLTDDETGCYTGATLEIEENCDSTPFAPPPIWIIKDGVPKIPNGVIPPGKEREDLINNIIWSEYEIFNRWGLKVFQSKNLLPEWDGYFENERVSPGVYYFIYKYEDSSRKSYYNNGFFQIFFEE